MLVGYFSCDCKKMRFLLSICIILCVMCDEDSSIVSDVIEKVKDLDIENVEYILNNVNKKSGKVEKIIKYLKHVFFEILEIFYFMFGVKKEECDIDSSMVLDNFLEDRNEDVVNEKN